MDINPGSVWVHHYVTEKWTSSFFYAVQKATDHSVMAFELHKYCPGREVWAQNRGEAPRLRRFGKDRFLKRCILWMDAPNGRAQS
jgi:hypothetical protein